MRHASRLLAALAVPVLVASLVLAHLLRAEPEDVQALPTVLVLLGLALVAATLVLMVEGESRLDGLTVPAGHRLAWASAGDRLPAPAWWGPAAASSAVAMAAGAYLSGWLLGLGTGLLLASLAAGAVHTAALRRHRDATGATDSADDAEPLVPLDRAVVRAARRVQAFADDHDGASAVVEHTGRYGARLTLVGGDGRLGDLQVGSVGRAELACMMAGVEPQEWDRALSASVHNTVYEWSKMGSRFLRPLPAPAPAVPATVVGTDAGAEAGAAV